MHMILHALFGLIIGLVARAIMPGAQHMGLILTMILGLVGAWLGGVIGRATGMYRDVTALSKPLRPSPRSAALWGCIATVTPRVSSWR
jgi:uncharacterized membrane protein YeaQ/YmgE (transglycosylase-associated protein family)